MTQTTVYKYIEKDDAYRRLNTRNMVIGGLAFVVLGILAYNVSRQLDFADAADLTKFQAGYIMSDFVMTNYTSMSEADIQAFLKSKNACNDVGIGRAYVYPNNTVSYNIQDGHFVCMADDVFLNAETGEMETAAHIIWQAAQDYQINPQVLITLLEKEQGLVTDTWPNAMQYRSATGYGCPDTAACDAKYYGFYNQVRNAASLFHTVMTGGWTNYPVGYNNVRFSPDAACGSSTVYIQNLATSALYRYTPYQPNQAALDAYPNTVHCGAYGNRNFYAYFENWFGSTTATGEPENVSNIYSAFSDYANKMGEQLGDYETLSLANKAITVQKFEKGNLVEVDGGVYTIVPEVYEKWMEATEMLGALASTQQENSETGIQWYDFEDGKLVGNAEKGWFISKGGSREVWAGQGFEGGALGFPVGNFGKNNQTGMEWQDYEGGVIVGNDSKGWYMSMGGSREVWKELGFESGPLGFPKTNFSCNSATGICWQDYEGGVIVGNDEKGWYESRGAIREKWAEAGFEGGRYGFPTSNILDGNHQNYEHGTIWL